jgi:hypothetical protein
VILTSGGTGGNFMSELARKQGPFNDMIDQLITNGFRVIDVKWEPEGIWTFPVNQTQGSRVLSQYYAVLVKLLSEILGNGHLLIAQGNCAGAAQIAFGLCYHGLREYLHLVNLSSALPPCPRYPLDRSSQVETISDDIETELDSLEKAVKATLNHLVKAVEAGLPASTNVSIRNPAAATDAKAIRDAVGAAITTAQQNTEKKITKAEIDVDQFWCYLAIRGLESIPGWFLPKKATPIGDLRPDTGRAWAKHAEPILLGNPILEYPNTEVHFFLGKHEDLPFIHEMTRLLHARMKPANHSSPITEVPSGHKIYDSSDGVSAMLQTIINIAQRFCSSCGHVNNPGQTHCANCGSQL